MPGAEMMDRDLSWVREKVRLREASWAVKSAEVNGLKVLVESKNYSSQVF